jgi:hypothetical protein
MHLDEVNGLRSDYWCSAVSTVNAWMRAQTFPAPRSFSIAPPKAGRGTDCPASGPRATS